MTAPITAFRKSLIQLALAAASLAVVAFSQNAQAAPHGKGMAQLDTDGSKTVSRAEAAKHPRLAERFDAIDANKDGQLTQDELKAHLAANGYKDGRGGHGNSHSKLDTDGSKAISRSEAASHPRLAERFDAIDTNKDGQLTQDEMKAHRATSSDKDRAQNAEEVFKRLDADNSGGVSKAEAAQRPRLAKHFDAIDANKDGQITREEAKAAHEKMKAKRGQR